MKKRDFILVMIFGLLAATITIVFPKINRTGIEYGKGHRLFINRLHEQAIPYLEDAVKRRPNFKEALTELSLSLLWTGRLDEAKERFVQLDKIDPGSLVSKRGLADIMIQKGDVDDGIDILKGLLKKNGADFLTVRTLADAYYQIKDYADAVPLYEKFLLVEPDHQEALVSFADSLYQIGETEKAENMIKEIEIRPAPSVHAYNTIGRFYFIRKDYDKAEEYYNKTLAIMPGNLEAMVQKRNLYLEKGDFDSGITFMKDEVLSFPNDPFIQIELGNTYLWTKHYNEAREVFNGVLEKFPDEYSAILGIGRSYAWGGDFKSALPYLGKSYQLSQNDPKQMMDLMLAYGVLGDRQKALDVYQNLLKINSNFTLEEKKKIAQILLDAGLYPQSEKLMKEIISEQPGDPDNFKKLGTLYERQGRFEEAQKEFERTLNKNKKKK